MYLRGYRVEPQISNEYVFHYEPSRIAGTAFAHPNDDSPTEDKVPQRATGSYPKTKKARKQYCLGAFWRIQRCLAASNAYKMKLEANKQQGARTDLTSSQVGTKSKRADEVIAEQSGESRNQVQRYIRLTELAPELMQLVDDKKIALNPAVEMSYLKAEEQSKLMSVMAAQEATPSLSQAQRLKRYSQ
jgi:hypothetical protein